MIVLDKTIKVQVWDTAGQERYRSITNAYYRGAEGIMIVFDLTNKESFKNIENWINEVTKYTGNNIIIICLGNKSDLKSCISKNMIEDVKKKLKISFFDVSAKTGDGVENAFQYIIEQLIKKSIQKKKVNGSMSLMSSKNSFKSDNGNEKNNNNCCGWKIKIVKYFYFLVF